MHRRTQERAPRRDVATAPPRYMHGGEFAGMMYHWRRQLRRALRTAQIYLPYGPRSKQIVLRFYRKSFRIPHEPEDTGIAHLPAKEGVFLDVGANMGQSVDSIRVFQPRAVIYAFEPNPSLVADLERRFADVESVRVFSFGLGAESAKRELFVPSYRGVVFDALGSLTVEGANSWLRRDALLCFDEKHLRIEAVNCRISTPDDLELAPLVFTIDTEGGDGNVILGGRRAIEAHRPILLLEKLAPTDMARQFLNQLDYRAYIFRTGRFLPAQKESVNTFFLPPERLHLIRSSNRGG